MLQVAPGSAYSSRVALGMAHTGLVGTVRFRLLDNSDTADDPVYGPATGSIVEDPAGSGSYVFTGTAPTTAGVYSRAWDSGADTELVFDADLEVTLTATASAGGPLYTTLAVLKDTLSYSPDSTYADAAINSAIEAASRGIEGMCLGRRFWLDDDNVARVYRPEMPDLLRIDDLAVPDTVVVDATVPFTLVAGTDFNYLERNALLDGKPYGWIELINHKRFPRFTDVTVTGQFGWPAVPAGIVEATTILASMLLLRKKHAPFGILASFDTGAVMRLGYSDPQIVMLTTAHIRRTPFLTT